MTTDPPLDQNTFTKRARRYGRVSGAAAGLATRVAGKKLLGIPIDTSKHAAALVAALGGLKGPLMKVGQILATIPEALPPEYAQAFQQLQSSAPSMGAGFVKRRMTAELGAGWEKKFANFDLTAAAAASLGQVHRATLPNGQIVACKLQYPDMAAAVSADLNQLKLIFSLYERIDSAITTDQIHAELSARLHEELDYTLEAAYTRLYGQILANVPGVHVADVIAPLSTPRLLTSTWLHGRKILDFVTAPAADRNQIAQNMFRAWYVPFYEYGVIHGDPHLGNYSVRDDLSLNLLDFGCCRIFPPPFVQGVIDLYHALLHNDRALAVHAYDTWGFKNLNKDQIDTLTLWAQFLYAPLLDDRVRPIGEVTGGVYGRDTARIVHQKLRAHGGVTVPREFVFMDRAALGLGSVFLHLNAEVNWHRIFNELIDDFNLDSLTKKQKSALKKAGLATP